MFILQNLYELLGKASFIQNMFRPLIHHLGNDSDQDSDKEPPPPAKVVDKPLARTGKRDASGTAPSEARGASTGGRGRGERRGGFAGNDGGRSKILLTL